MRPARFAFLLLFGSAVIARGADASAEPPANAAAPAAAPDATDEPEPAPAAAAVAAVAPQPPKRLSALELQVELHRRGFSCGSIDGVVGGQTVAAVKAFQRSVGVAETGIADAATCERLTLSAPATEEHVVLPAEVANLQPVPDTWVGKSQLETLNYATPLELIAEKFHASPKFLQKLNPAVDWNNLLPGAKIIVPAVDRVTVVGTPSQIVITLGARELDVLDDTSRVIAHFPVSIAHMAEKRPVGDLHVTVVISRPDYTFDPAVFPESPEAQALGHKLIIPPGPNNPVGLAWIGLDRPGYGIHGTPEPEKIGRTESHGCFRLANWDAQTLLGLVEVGTPVLVVE